MRPQKEFAQYVCFNVLTVVILKGVPGGILPHAHLNGKLKNVEI